MAQRTIRAAVTTYVLDGVPRYGLRGETVQVDDDTLEAFDEGEEVAAPKAAASEPESAPAASESDAPKKRAARKSAK